MLRSRMLSMFEAEMQDEERRPAVVKSEADALRVLLETRAGRLMIHNILHSCGTFARTQASTTDQERAFYEGRRSVGVDFLSYLGYMCPEVLPGILSDYQTGFTYADETGKTDA